MGVGAQNTAGCWYTGSAMSLTDEKLDSLVSQRQIVQQTLLQWFSENARDLPWRHTRTPYRVWISEVMLQQTQVEKVRDYFNRFIARFPTVHILAAASLEEVLKLWEGLGYYSRARSLHKAATLVVAKYEGHLPRDVKTLRALPGIGAYSAAAIASIAYNIPAAAVDGNVRRVIARYLAEPSPSSADLEEAVNLLLPQEASGKFTEALIELGAVICRPKNPQCSVCPWQAQCRAQLMGQTTAYPAPKPRKTIPHYDVVAAVTVRDDHRVLVARRPQDAMLGGLWEFPGGKREVGESLTDALQRELEEEMEIGIEVGQEVVVIHHAYTHFRITLYAFYCLLVSGTPRCIACSDFRWATLEEIRELPMAVTDRKIAHVIESKLMA
ncbi:MAG: A/G-specific adenine glycosylase [Anaerolineales bacterium]|nr:MAG: A/G-specific adenine glycosylase [Anaerolineales bacterium]